MKSNFGNYVIQKALKIAIGENKKILVNEVNNNIYKLNDKKLIEKWKKIILSLLKIEIIIFLKNINKDSND